jgi:hypothetical protein
MPLEFVSGVCPPRREPGDILDSNTRAFFVDAIPRDLDCAEFASALQVMGNGLRHLASSCVSRDCTQLARF